MARPIISAQNLGKRYRLGATLSHDTLRDHIAHGFRRLFQSKIENRKSKNEDEFIWALKDVSFAIEEGEVVGIIGRNGAGKSTLLKVLSRITEPTEGEVRIRGRVASLLEVGTGFHPELSGRENVFLNGAILGMKKAEIKSRFDEIVAFAEVEKFIDTPVKRYSSGMHMRLAFAVAAHLEPEILIIDEVLAVGDAAFQKKCLGKMQGVAKQGRTVLFVSHNMIAVESLCTRVMTLANGRVQNIAPAREAISSYLCGFAAPDSRERIWEGHSHTQKECPVRLRRVAVLSGNGSGKDEITMETPVRIEVDFWNLVPGSTLHVTLHILTDQGIVAFGTSSFAGDATPAFDAGLIRSCCSIPGNLLNSGMHLVTLLVVRDGSTVVLREEEAVTFEITEPERRSEGWFGKLAGAVRPKIPWTIGRVSDQQTQAEPFHVSTLDTPVR